MLKSVAAPLIYTTLLIVISSAPAAGAPLNMDKFCASNYGSSSKSLLISRNNPSSWRCISGADRPVIIADAVCQQQYGSNYYPRLLDPNDGYSWSCERSEPVEQPIDANVEHDVEWCINGDATYRIYQQPMRGYCPSVAAGGAVGIWYAPQYAKLVLTMTQKQWSRQAIKMACSLDVTTMTAAVGLLAACQCHNTEAADRIINRPRDVLRKLRSYDGAGCSILDNLPFN